MRARAGVVAAAIGVCGLATAAVLASPASGRRSQPPSELRVFALANRCFALRSVGSGRYVAASGSSSYAARATSPGAAMPFYMKPTGLGTYLLYGKGARLMSVGPDGATVGRAAGAGPKTEFALGVAATGRPGISIRSTANRGLVFARGGGGRLALSGRTGLAGSALFTFVPRSGCTAFPEAQVDAVAHGQGTITKNGKIFGFVDDHVHVTGNMRAGGDVISGEPYDRFGIPTALGEDAKVHGPDGKLDVTGNLLRSGSPVGTHDTHGWPTFVGWPTYNSMTHQQAYYVWVERAWRAGMRMMVAQTADDSPLCRLEPRHAVPTCSETASIEAQIRTLKGLESYVDAQAGGPGRGWFRLVYSPAQARQVMRAGKLAVLIGIESSDLFGCSLSAGKADCTRADIDRGLARYKRLGVRGMFVAHWVNNAFAGSALETGAKGIFINILNRFQTGSYFKTGACPDPGQGASVGTLPQSFLKSLTKYFPAATALAQQPMPTYPSGLQCNSRRLTPLGRYLIQRLIANHMLIEVDHLSEWARDEVLTMAEQAHYPLDLEPQRDGRRVVGVGADPALQAGWVCRGDTRHRPHVGREDPRDREVPGAGLRLFRRGARHRHQRLRLAARTATGRRPEPAALPVQVIRRQRDVHARGNRHPHLRPQQGWSRQLRLDGRPDRRHAAHRCRDGERFRCCSTLPRRTSRPGSGPGCIGRR